jgi:GNAT superfamily N-acetyltransferase
VIQYRTFRNGDPPALVDLWNECFIGRGAAYLSGTTLLEYFTLAKPYFDPAGLILAVDAGRPVGFAHAGFGPDAAGKGPETASGVVCTLGVLPGHRRRGVGAELLRRAEEYLRGRGARELYAGPLHPRNPFTFALYGGSQSAGFLDSDPLARPFFERHGYRPRPTRLVFHRPLEQPPTVADGRFPAYRQRYEILAVPRHGLSRWDEAVIGPVELHEYRLQDKAGGRLVARATAWEMETFAPRWNEHAVGIVEADVVPELRRQGLAKFLLAQLLRHLHEQFFTLVEVHIDEGDAVAAGLFRGLGFEAIDAGRAYRKEDGAG